MNSRSALTMLSQKKIFFFPRIVMFNLKHFYLCVRNLNDSNHLENPVKN